jgi:anti-sigma factor RsiW
MTHPEDLLADYVSGALTDSERATVDAHLAGCPECSADVSRARAARSALRALPEVSVPTGVASRALEEATRTAGGPGWYRWLGVAAAAAVVALIAITLPHLGTSPATTEVGAAAPAIAGGSSSTEITKATTLHLSVQETDYDQAGIDQLTDDIAGQLTSSTSAGSGLAPLATPEERIGTGAELQAALTCVRKAVSHGLGTPIKLILTRVDGTASFLAFYRTTSEQGQGSSSLDLWIVDGHTCTTSAFSSTRL